MSQCTSRWTKLSQRHGLEVLHDGSDVELVASTCETPEPEALEAVMGLQVGKTHLHHLALIA